MSNKAIENVRLCGSSLIPVLVVKIQQNCWNKNYYKKMKHSSWNWIYSLLEVRIHSAFRNRCWTEGKRKRICVWLFALVPVMFKFFYHQLDFQALFLYRSGSECIFGDRQGWWSGTFQISTGSETLGARANLGWKPGTP